MEPKEFVTTNVAAKEMCVARRTIQDWIKEGKVKAYRYGRLYLLNRKDWEEFKARKVVAVKL